jgi:hypothetical protein
VKAIDLYFGYDPALLSSPRYVGALPLGSGSVDFVVPVDIADAIFLLSYLVGLGPHRTCLDAGYANDDGRLDLADPIYLLGYLTGQLPPMSTPFPACGYESDIDELDCQQYQCL